MIGRLRRWAQGYTRRRRYSPLDITLHWTTAALVLFQLWWGLRTGQLPASHYKVEAYVIHSQVGLFILVLTLLRMTWRLMVPGPLNDADKPGWRSTAAHLTHYTFYVCLIGLPISGWAMLSATAPEQALSVAGVAPWPHLPFHDLSPAQRWVIEAWSERIHFGFIATLLVLIPLHVAATVQHHVLHRHDVLIGMLPGITRLERAILKGSRRRPPGRRSPRTSGAG